MIKQLKEYKKLSKSVLGINARNLLYTDRKSISISNSKIRVKEILKENLIPTPETISIIKSFEEINSFDFSSLPNSFVIKPNKGLGGEGIIILYGRKKKRNLEDEDAWISANKQIINLSELKIHMVNILNGYYSINKKNDKVILEERIKNPDFFKQSLHISEGLPDIRVIIYKNFPIMAELRIPTIESKGKANLHSGGIGVGIDIANGTTTNAIMKDEYIENHPDTEEKLTGIKIPYWDKILEMAIKSSIAIKASFTGVDISIDKEKGPLVMEVNARPGLSIQIANKDGLKERLESISKLKVNNIKSNINIAKQIFGGEIEEEISEITGKIVLGRNTKVRLNDKENIIAKVDTGAYSNAISYEIAGKVGYSDIIEEFQKANIPKNIDINSYYRIKEKLEKENPDRKYIVLKSSNGISLRPLVNIKLTFVEEEIEIITTTSIAERDHLKYDMILGRKDLKNFLIDVTKNL
jgi:alpha-L-glutamate ligase-like protein